MFLKHIRCARISEMHHARNQLSYTPYYIFFARTVDPPERSFLKKSARRDALNQLSHTPFS